MIKIIELYDGEEDCSLLVSIDSEHSGVLLYGTNQYKERVSMLFDDRLLKKLCNEVSKSIKSRATKANSCGKVKYYA